MLAATNVADEDIEIVTVLVIDVGVVTLRVQFKRACIGETFLRSKVITYGQNKRTVLFAVLSASLCHSCIGYRNINVST